MWVHSQALTHNVRRFRFALPSAEQVLGLQTGQCVYVCTELEDTPIIRPYTPVTYDERHQGYFELVFKVYFKGALSARVLPAPQRPIVSRRFC